MESTARPVSLSSLKDHLLEVFISWVCWNYTLVQQWNCNWKRQQYMECNSNTAISIP